MAKPDWGELQQRFLSEHAATGVSPKEWCEAQGLNYATARRYIKKTSAQTAQKPAQKKVRIAQKEQSANELMDDDGLTAQQRLFVAEYLKDGNATQAAIRAGYSKKSAEQIGYQLLQKTSVAQAIAQQQKASIARTLGGADEVLAQMWQLATFDANQLSQYRRGACRYCWGFGHQYQWRDMVEFEEKRLEALERKSREPADVGGYSYDHNREPNPACPRCNGDGNDIKQANDELEQQAKDIAKNAQDVGKVQTSVNELSSTVGNVSSSLSQLEQTVATADTALGQRIDNISVSMDGMTGGVKNSAIAIIQANLAQVATRKTLSASVAGNSANLDRIDEVIVNDREATARSLLSLQTDVNGNKASINSLNQTFSDYQQAMATQVNSITATVNGHTSAITTNAQAIANVNGDLKAMYNIKVGVASNGQYYAAGMGIGVENTPSGMQSQVIFLADRFAVTHQAGATVTLPFVIQNGQVFIRDALIGDGTISNAKIGNYIQSNNYVAGSVGWRLDKGGTFENYGSTTGEGSMKQTNQTISVRDSRNVLRVQIGRITGTW
ncbi:hypothetical protein CK478_02385 [Enterobacter hormaechei]|nr:hypothetical protein CK478_02385 [Enterobacter hormaechei]